MGGRRFRRHQFFHSLSAQRILGVRAGSSRLRESALGNSRRLCLATSTDQKSMNEADTCRKLIRPKLEAVGWDSTPHLYNEQVSFTDGRIVVAGSKVRRRKRKIADFLLRFTRDVTLGVVEAKSDEEPAGAGMQQAKD